jgi:GNAT superfamily N-acetyltransferase
MLLRFFYVSEFRRGNACETMTKLHIKPKTISLRPITKRDEPFLRKAYEASRDEEMKDVLWTSDAQREAFFRMQFDAQKIHYEKFFPDADFDIIEVGGKSAGRLIHSWGKENMHLVDMILLPEYRKQRIGTVLMDAIIKEVDRRGLSASVMYQKWKPYMEKFYGKYGYKTTQEHPWHFTMEREKKLKM